MAMQSALQRAWRSSLRLSTAYLAAGTQRAAVIPGASCRPSLRSESTSVQDREDPPLDKSAKSAELSVSDSSQDASSTSPSPPAPPPIPNQLLQELIANMKGDLPVEEMENPYAKAQRKCILCRHKVDLDYKNVQLLSQFVSPYTGRIYGRHITRLCIPMQKRVAHLIKRAQYFGFMPFMMKNPTYLMDPKLFDPFKSQS